ncbi:alpha/beta fold hydrolase [Streptomyces sp. NPDC059740]|uniref:alpha/beta fold hydrolase n=1 Tax=Streptomyces sp. NPDC059740 TaxID=3346926 RepID=UPI003653F7AC
MTGGGDGSGAAAAAGRVARGAGGWARAGRHVGVAGLTVGVAAAGAAAGVAVERLNVGRGLRRRAQLALDAAGPFGTLRGVPGLAVAEDGTELYYEVDEADPAEDGAGTRPTVVFCHGYCLNQDSWHFQRAALRGAFRTVHWDQRGHGRSGRARATRPVTIDLLGGDLRAVLDATVEQGPVVLVGHSMGGMTIMALADRFPDLVAERVAGVALVGTSAGRLSEVAFGLPTAGVKAFHRLAPGVLKALGSQPGLVERGRRVGADLLAALVRRYSFGTPEAVDPGVARFAERMIEATPIDVVAAFYPAFAAHDKVAALAAFEGVPAVVVAGDRDLVTPPDHAQTVADQLPAAALHQVPGAGHLVMLERPDLLDPVLTGLVQDATRYWRTRTAES